VRNALIIFAKAPGVDVKTRLKGHLSDTERIELYSTLLESTIKKLGTVPVADTFISYTPPDAAACFSKYGLRIFSQAEGDLGDRMRSAMNSRLSEGYGRVVLVGVDIPELSACIIQQAFELLSAKDIVFGPARDGGYYLIGMTGTVHEIFTGIEWSTEHVLRISIEKARNLGLQIGFTQTLSDLDTIGDLRRIGI